MNRYVRVAALSIAAISTALPSSHSAEPTPADVVADQVRSQGYACDRVLSADRGKRGSEPDEPIWILKCSNGSYRVRLVGDMAARIEKID